MGFAGEEECVSSGIATARALDAAESDKYPRREKKSAVRVVKMRFFDQVSKIAGSDAENFRERAQGAVEDFFAREKQKLFSRPGLPPAGQRALVMGSLRPPCGRSGIRFGGKPISRRAKRARER